MTDEEKILQYLKLFIAEDAVTELRALPVSRESGQTMTGLYDYTHLHLMAEHAVELEKTGQYKGIYFMPNPIKREKYTSCVRPNSVVPARTVGTSMKLIPPNRNVLYSCKAPAPF